MSNEYRERLLGIAVISKRTRDRVVEGKEHPETGRRFKAVTNELGTVTEHSAPGAAPGVSDRQDVNVTPQAVKLTIGMS